MIIYKKGDIVRALKEGDISLLAHGCNCSGGFGSGVAGAIAYAFPGSKEYFMSTKHVHELGLVLDDVEHNILHCFTQQNYGRDGKCYVDYQAIRAVMFKLAEYYSKDGRPMGIPKIGSGLGGGDWNIIEKIINKAFFGQEIWIYEL